MSATTATSPAAPSPAAPGVRAPRILSIDALRGLVMVLMLADHVREFFYLHAQMSDPVDVASTEPALFFSRFVAHFCAPVFIGLTGVSAWLYGRKRGVTGPDGQITVDRAAASAFLFKRGLFLIVLELTIISFAWTFSIPPAMFYLQVIWAIGLSMVALSALLWAPRPVLLAIGAVIVLGHNLLDPITLASGQPGHALWAVLHDRGIIDLPFSLQARTSYPVLPWIGVIALGFVIGPWFAPGVERAQRQRRLMIAAVTALLGFIVLRGLNGYGEAYPWVQGETGLRTVMSFLNLTKYPPSLDFLLVTLGGGLLALALLEHAPERPIRVLSVFGGAPLFFYIVHLYVLHLLNLFCLMIFGRNQGDYFSLPGVGAIWLLTAVTAVALWPLCRAFIRFKARNGHPLLSYL